jgi:hypothetical protein
MKIDAQIIDWNKAPFNMDNKIPKNVRDAICKRFEVAISNLRDTDRYKDLNLSDGWVIPAKDNVSFVINPIKNEDLPNNADLKDETLDVGKNGAKLREIRDTAWDCEKYSDMAKIAGLSLDQGTGKITYKLI